MLKDLDLMTRPIRPRHSFSDMVNPVPQGVAAGEAVFDDLERDVYCVLGLPIDAMEMPAALSRIEAAAAHRIAYLVSTPNLDFLVQCRSDPEFRDSVLDSNLCPADGMPIVWIAQLLGLPIHTRVSGADIFEALRAPHRLLPQLRVCLFGGGEGIADAAARSLNDTTGGLFCVRAINPGFGSVNDLSREPILEQVNSSGADFLVVALGAQKGQRWLHRNRRRLAIPVRAHFGAVINFQAGTVKRAPAAFRACGLEWLWRIKEEPYLWSRYARDGLVLLSLMFTRVLPLAVSNRWSRRKSDQVPQNLRITVALRDNVALVALSGDAIARHIDGAISGFREALTVPRDVMINLSTTRMIDARFFGLLLMLRKRLKEQGRGLSFIGASRAIRRIFRMNDLGHLLEPEVKAGVSRT